MAGTKAKAAILIIRLRPQLGLTTSNTRAATTVHRPGGSLGLLLRGGLPLLKSASRPERIEQLFVTLSFLLQWLMLPLPLPPGWTDGLASRPVQSPPSSRMRNRRVAITTKADDWLTSVALGTAESDARSILDRVVARRAKQTRLSPLLGSVAMPSSWVTRDSPSQS